MTSILLVGHRGVGKSTLLALLEREYQKTNWQFESLDSFIEREAGLSIPEIFSEMGEARFREIETQCLKKLAENEQIVIDVGAGYLGPKPKDSFVLWVMRDYDPRRARFLNRPNLDGKATLSNERFLQRQKHYEKLCDFHLLLRPGKEVFANGEKVLFDQLLKQELKPRLNRWMFTLDGATSDLEKQSLKNLGLSRFELRTDLLDESSIEELQENNLISYRLDKDEKKFDHSFWDEPLEWGLNSDAPIQSLHQFEGDFTKTAKSMEKVSGLQKLALPIDNFSQLIEGHRWLMEDPERRSFLPMSINGRWSWYRLLMARIQKINFLKLASGSAADQPTLLQVLNFEDEFPFFAAILGTPVSHSFTPTFHQDYFQDKWQANTLAIDVREDEVSVALPFLAELGLRWAAVTSPLKQRMATFCQAKHPAINTLFFDGESWHSENTDDFGLQRLVENIKDPHCAVWGGGGTLSSVRQVLPKAQFFSSRTGELKGDGDIREPKSLIWAVSSQLFEKKGVLPPKAWPVDDVYDLNYGQDSPGLACAQMYGCQYHSGLVMFEAQAYKQQEFWNGCRLK